MAPRVAGMTSLEANVHQDAMQNEDRRRNQWLYQNAKKLLTAPENLPPQIQGLPQVVQVREDYAELQRKQAMLKAGPRSSIPITSPHNPEQSPGQTGPVLGKVHSPLCCGTTWHVKNQPDRSLIPL